MNNVFNRDNEKWIRPWNEEKFDDLYNRDERFFSLVIKGLLSWLNRNIVLYNQPINHFIFNTGSSYLYMESNGYEYNLSETTGEDTMYMKLPRCIIELSDINVPTDELSSPYGRGYYEHRSGNMICGYNAEIRRLPIELTVNAKYYLSNFNESLVLLQELFDKIIFQRYYRITYLGQEIQCSIEFPGNVNPELNKIDMASPDPTMKNITLDFKICTNYPIIDIRTEIPTDKVIVNAGTDINLHKCDIISDNDKRGKMFGDQSDHYEDLKDTLKQLNDLNNKSDSEEPIDDPNVNPDTNNDEDVFNRLDINKDGELNKDDVIDMLEIIKYGYYVDQADANDDGMIKYDDVQRLVSLLNTRDDVNVDYDSFMNKIYIHHTDSLEQEEIDLIKYKIE